jgi:hypothetical protein
VILFIRVGWIFLFFHLYESKGKNCCIHYIRVTTKIPQWALTGYPKAQNFT